MNAAATIVVFVAVFAVIFRGTVDRGMAMLTGAAVMLLVGIASGFFSAAMALDAIYFETLALIFGMSAISATLARSGLFSVIAERTSANAAGNGWWVLVLFSLVTYGFSLLVNNLAAMVVILPVALTLCRRLKLNPVPVVIAQIIASNLGGASTMIGDFPNMIISSAAKLHFLDFVGGMMPACLVLLAVMFAFFQWNRAGFEVVAPKAGRLRPDMVPPQPGTRLDPRLTGIGLTILGAALAGFLVADLTGVRPGWIALTAGVAALVLGGFDKEEILSACGAKDILFFLGLFIMVGGLVAAGVLDGFIWLIDHASGGHGLFRLLLLMWVAAISTIFLNAGPATAFFVPVAATIHASFPGTEIVWWALSLGVLAGSSAALTGATAGAVAATQLERFVKTNPDMRAVIPAGAELDFRGYLRWGMPIMVLFLGLSSLYVMVMVGGLELS